MASRGIRARCPSRRMVVVGLTGLLSGALTWGLLAATALPSGWPAHSDLGIHAAIFACLVLPGSWHSARATGIVVIYALLLGLLIEIVQPYVGRSRDVSDLLANVLGTLAGACCGRGVGLLAREPRPSRSRASSAGRNG